MTPADALKRISVLHRVARREDLAAFYYGRKHKQTGDPRYDSLRKEAESIGDLARIEIADLIRKHGPGAPCEVPPIVVFGRGA